MKWTNAEKVLSWIFILVWILAVIIAFETGMLIGSQMAEKGLLP